MGGSRKGVWPKKVVCHESRPMSARRFGAIEAGGTKFLCAVGSSAADLQEQVRIPTTSPADTLKAVLSYFDETIRKHGPLHAIGIASFGPAEVNRKSPRWGSILDTPKPGWSGTDLVRPLSEAFGVPVGFDTDVNAAALSEYTWGAAAGCDVATYVTVGTGIGGGTVVNGRPIHGLRHSEVGHLFPPRHPGDMAFEGTCPFHGDCLEGLASGPAIEKRWGASLSNLPPDHLAHDVIAFYLAHLAISLQAVLSPRRIVFGGGVLDTPGLIEKIRETTGRLGAGYFVDSPTAKGLIAAPMLGRRSGLLGAILLAEATWRESR